MCPSGRSDACIAFETDDAPKGDGAAKSLTGEDGEVGFFVIHILHIIHCSRLFSIQHPSLGDFYLCSEFSGVSALFAEDGFSVLVFS